MHYEQFQCQDFRHIGLYWRSWLNCHKRSFKQIRWCFFIDFLIDTNVCVLNGRFGDRDNFTCVSHHGRSIADEQLITEFKVLLMSDPLKLEGYNNVSDHSVLEWTMRKSSIEAKYYPRPTSTTKRYVAATTLVDKTKKIRKQFANLNKTWGWFNGWIEDLRP